MDACAVSQVHELRRRILNRALYGHYHRPLRPRLRVEPDRRRRQL
jgi:hypothetical protein